MTVLMDYLVSMHPCRCDHIAELELAPKSLCGGSKGIENPHQYLFIGVKCSFRRSCKVESEHDGLLCSGDSPFSGNSDRLPLVLSTELTGSGLL